MIEAPFRLTQRQNGMPAIGLPVNRSNQRRFEVKVPDLVGAATDIGEASGEQWDHQQKKVTRHIAALLESRASYRGRVA